MARAYSSGAWHLPDQRLALLRSSARRVPERCQSGARPVPGTANCPERSAAAREGFERGQRAAGVEPVDERGERLLARPAEERERPRAERERALAVCEPRARMAAAHLPDRA